MYANLLGNYPSLGIRQKLTVIWLASRLQDNLLGNLEKTEWFLLGIDSWKFDLTGEEGFISVEVL